MTEFEHGFMLENGYQHLDISDMDDFDKEEILKLNSELGINYE